MCTKVAIAERAIDAGRLSWSFVRSKVLDRDNTTSVTLDIICGRPFRSGMVRIARRRMAPDFFDGIEDSKWIFSNEIYEPHIRLHILLSIDAI